MTYLNNHLLIAMPGLQDPNFNRSVTYVCEHNAYGAIGIIINRPTDLTLKYVFNRLKIETGDLEINKMPLLFGGPIQQEQGFIIHRPLGKWQSSLEVTENVAITTSKDVLEAIAKGEGPEDMLIALGYAGWDAEQLEKEIRENSWLSCPATPEVLFDTPFSDRWKVAVSLLGVDINKLSSDAGHA